MLLAVSDSGCGMSAETLEHAFEPFFTTKGPEHGTGLGLATVFGIVQQSGGHLEAYSEVGIGTTIKVYLPCVQQEAPPPPAPAAMPSSGKGTVLLVEDETMVRSLVNEVLTMFGYTVLPASNGLEALEIVNRLAPNVDLLLTDVVMPGGMGGRQLAERLRAERPSLKVLYMSGYTDDAVVRHGIVEADTAFIQKPFTAVALARKVKEVLG
jgi:CheY-like chemotaxis protein